MIMSFVVGDGWPRSWILECRSAGVRGGDDGQPRADLLDQADPHRTPDWVLPTLLFASVVIVGLVVETWLTLALIGLIYLCSLPLGVMSARRMRKGEVATTAETPTDEARRGRTGGQPGPAAAAPLLAGTTSPRAGCSMGSTGRQSGILLRPNSAADCWVSTSAG